MGTFAAPQPAMSAGDNGGATGQAKRRCVRHGCQDPAADIVSDPRAESVAREVDVDVINEVLSRVLLDSSVRAGVRVHEGRLGLLVAGSARWTPAVDTGGWLSPPSSTVTYMTRFANPGEAL